MALATYSDLQTAVASWLSKSGDTTVTGNAADFILLAEQDIRTRLDTMAMETENTSFSLSSEFVALSTIDAQITSIRRIILSVDGARPLEYRTPEQLNIDFPVVKSGQPIAYTIESNHLQFRDTPDSTYTAEIVYRKWFDPLSTTATNALLTSWPGIYLYASLKRAALFLRDQDGIALYSNEFEAACQLYERAQKRLTYPAGALITKSDTGAP